MAEYVFNEENLMCYLNQYDYIFEKYGISKADADYVDYAEYEAIRQSPDVVKRDYAAIYDNIRLVYGDDEKADRMLHIYKIVKEEVINKFLNIPGLERMYDEHFFEFEWDMHSRLDFDSHNISFYRDHFIHQVRNFYEMNMFLKDEKFRKNFTQEFYNGDNKISAYVKNGVKKLTEEQNSAKQLKPLIRRIKEEEEKAISVECTALTAAEAEERINSKVMDGIRGFYINYIMKASIALSSLFHDIGYPIQHFEKMRKRIAGFMPSMYMFLGDEGNNFEHIYALLCNSLLFRIVHKEELRIETCSGNNHGAISAVAFLLMFYGSGVIETISAEKRIAIEIAAVAIYNHTLKYKCLKEDKNEAKSYYRPIYKLNPLSYLLRICDDIQEWERTYFEIQSIPDILICEKCGTPLIRTQEKTSMHTPDRYIYRCRCGRRDNIMRNDDFVRRKIIDIINCKEVEVNFDNSFGDKIITINFDYQEELLLKMCLHVPGFAKYRIKDINKIKGILEMQVFGGYDATVINFLLTPNPFILKARILEKFINIDTADLNLKPNVCGDLTASINECITDINRYYSSWDDKINRILSILANEDSEDSFFTSLDETYDLLEKEFAFVKSASKLLIEKTYPRRAGRSKKINESNAKNLAFYYILAIISRFFKIMNTYYYDAFTAEKRGKSLRDKTIDYLKVRLYNTIKKKIGKEAFVYETRVFIDDALMQYSKMFDENEEDMYKLSDRLLKEEYYTHCKTSGQVYGAVERYTYANNPMNADFSDKLDYYSDLSFYSNLSEYVRIIKRSI